MIHIFESPDGTAFIAEVCDIGLTESPINLSLANGNAALDYRQVTLDVGSVGWIMMGLIFDMINEDEGGLDTHAPIVDLVASVHWAAIAEPDAMGAI